MRPHPVIVWAILGVVGLLVAGYGAYRARFYFLGRHHYQAGQIALAQRDFELADKQFRECLLYWPDDPTTTLLLAQSYRRMGDFDGAEKVLGACEKLGVPASDIAFERSLIAVQRGDLTNAERLLETCRERPDARESSLALEAILKGGLKRLPQPGTVVIMWHAERKLRAVLTETDELWLASAKVPEDESLGLVCRGRLRLLQGKHADGLADLRHAVELSPGNFEARLQLALVLLAESPHRAISHLQALYRRDPSHRQARYYLASALRAVGELEEAREVLDLAIRDEQPDVSCMIERGLLALDMRQFADAERRLRHALSLAPNLARAHLALSRCLQAVGKKEEARRHWEQFTRMEPER
jgi:tetratricopeptide (TPR) repeat protein